MEDVCFHNCSFNSQEIQDIPPILSSGALPIFAEMLDIHSFMRLAMTNKEIYERCMKDKTIRINLEENEVAVRVVDGAPTFSFYSIDVSDHNVGEYLDKLRQIKCHVSLRKIRFELDVSNVTIIVESRRYLKEIGVKKIDSLTISGEFAEFSSWQQISSFAKDFHVQNVDIDKGLPDEVLRSLLQSNAIQGKMLLEVDSPITLISLSSIHFSADVFTQILWKIQTGALKKLIVDSDNIPWHEYTKIEDDKDGPLPKERPLLIEYIEYSSYEKKLWFLHWDGGVTKCTNENRKMEISKCDPEDYPLAVNSKESVHKALAEKRTISCFKHHFMSYFDKFEDLDASHEGPFPEQRPLVCKSEELEGVHFFVLNENGSIDVYWWEMMDNQAKHSGHYDMEKEFPDQAFKHPSLKQFIFDARLEKHVQEGDFDCEDIDEFRNLFKAYKVLSLNVRIIRPRQRLVFKKKEAWDDMESRIVLYEDGSLIQYTYDNCEVTISPCPTWNRPSILISPENLKEILLNPPLLTLKYRMTRSVFSNAFKEFTNFSFHAFGHIPMEFPLVFKKTEHIEGKVVEERWFVNKNGTVKKCEWADVRAKITFGETAEYPPILTKMLIKAFFKGEPIDTHFDLIVARAILNDYMEEFEIFSFDEPGPLPVKRPLIFQKSEIKHVCRKHCECDCVDEKLHLWLFSHCGKTIQVTWEAEDDGYGHLSFHEVSNITEVPPMLRTKETLHYILKNSGSGDNKIQWYGTLDDFASFFEGHRILDYNYEGRLPRIRPLSETLPVVNDLCFASLFTSSRFKDNNEGGCMEVDDTDHGLTRGWIIMLDERDEHENQEEGNDKDGQGKDEEVEKNVEEQEVEDKEEEEENENEGQCCFQ